MNVKIGHIPLIIGLMSVALILPLITPITSQEGVSITIIAPADKNLKDGVIISGRYSHIVRVIVTNNLGRSLSNVEISCTIPSPITGYTDRTPVILKGDPTDMDKLLKYGEMSTGEWKAGKPYILLESLEPGIENSIVMQFYIRPPESGEIKEKTTVTFTVTVTAEGETYTASKQVVILPPPMWRVYATAGISLILIPLIYVLGTKYLKRLGTIDLIYMSIFSALMVVWVWLGRMFIFPLVNRIPLTYEFAVADTPYIIILVSGAMVIAKPLSVSGMLFIYNIVMEIIYYGINPLWWSYPFIEGLPSDLWLLIRGKGAFKGKLKYLDGFAVAGLRGVFMQLGLFLVYRPALQHLYFPWGRVLFVTLSWALGNAIAGIISVPIGEKIKQALI